MPHMTCSAAASLPQLPKQIWLQIDVKPRKPPHASAGRAMAPGCAAKIHLQSDQQNSHGLRMRGGSHAPLQAHGWRPSTMELVQLQGGWEQALHHKRESSFWWLHMQLECCMQHGLRVAGSCCTKRAAPRELVQLSEQLTTSLQDDAPVMAVASCQALDLSRFMTRGVVSAAG